MSTYASYVSKTAPLLVTILNTRCCDEESQNCDRDFRPSARPVSASFPFVFNTEEADPVRRSPAAVVNLEAYSTQTLVERITGARPGSFVDSLMSPGANISKSLL